MPQTIKLILNSSHLLEDIPLVKMNWSSELTWVIGDSLITSFRIIGKDSTEKPPFKGGLNPNFTTREIVNAKNFIFDDWKYKIEYTTRYDDSIKTLDPIISVKPRPFDYFITGAVILVLIPLSRYLYKRFSR